MMLTLTPANLIAKSLQTVTLPPLSRARSDTGDFQRIYDRCCSVTALAALASILGALLLGKVIIALLFGEKFMPAAGFLTALACMNALRLLRVAPTIAAMAHGETRNPLYANMVRALGVPLAMAAATLSGSGRPTFTAFVALPTLLRSDQRGSSLSQRCLGWNWSPSTGASVPTISPQMSHQRSETHRSSRTPRSTRQR
ncbi:oligosaccharide flippase family protein [Sphingomonas sp. IC4-52]|uniref:oligosaccharide flippase family protein n=1 Tax=Sphingomonas sp. IC4-52 TaxID=2887202 RepID=UPI002AB3247A|nr:oligosaccharide flippase family protein [Sphingomonas sp. IC4-52]